MKKVLLYIVLFCMLPVVAQNDHSLFEKGNAAYNEGDYTAAVESYQRILDNGQESVEVYFNLANAHYKLNQVAPSVYYYEKALQLAPRDRDIKGNLVFAENMVLDEIEKVEKSGFSKIWNSVISVVTYDQWAWVAVIMSFLFAGSFLLYFFSRKSGSKRAFFSVSISFLIIAAFAVLFAFQQLSYYSDNQFAIIFSEEAPVRNEPTFRANETYTLHAGTKVEVLETYQNWIKFELVNGNQGWLEEEHLKFL